MADQLELLAQWLNTEIEKNETYHNHKETMAWTATTMWLTASGYLYIKLPEWIMQDRVLFTISYLLIAILVLVVVNMQFSCRWEAANRTTALRRAMCELCVRIDLYGQQATLPKRWLKMQEAGYPLFVDEALQAGNTIPNSSRSLASLVSIQGKRVDRRWKTEIPSYLSMLIATVSVIYRVWSNGEVQSATSIFV